MSSNRSSVPEDASPSDGKKQTGRRHFLRTFGSAAVATSLAGCEDLSSPDDGPLPDRSFVAERISLRTSVAAETGYVLSEREAVPDAATATVDGEEQSLALVSQIVRYRRERSTGVPGETAGLGVLSTPVASIDEQGVNPLTSTAAAELLTTDEGARLLAAAGIGTEASWVEGPTPTGIADVDVLGSSVRLTRYVGVVDDGALHLTIAHVGRARSADDTVFAVATTREPLPAGGGSIRPGSVAASALYEATVPVARDLFEGLVVGTDVGTVTTAEPPEPARIFNRNIDGEAHERLHAYEDEGVRCVAFHPDGGWVIITRQNTRFARNIPDECYEKLKEFQSQGKQILWVAFPPAGGNSWSIIHDAGFFNREVPDDLHERMVAMHEDSHELRRVAFPPQGGNRWLVLSDSGSFARNIPDECWQIMRNINQGPRRVHHVAFEPGGGWIVVADDYHFARNVDDELFSTMNDFAADDDRIDVVAFDPDGRGWSIVSNGRVGRTPFDPIRAFEADVDGTSIWQAMRDADVPGVSVAVVRNNQLDWATGYGHVERDSGHAVHPETVFQAASISKTLAAIGAVAMARDGTLDLDADVNDIMSGWTLETEEGVTTTNAPTVRRLLSHSGGTNVHGFGGYPDTNGVILPNTEQVLSGDGPANSSQVQIVYDPGTDSDYSGGGYTVVQRCMTAADGAGFDTWMWANVLIPMRMDDSTFSHSLPQRYFDDGLVASGHDSNGNVILGERNRYPESAAAGLYTTALDLARVIRMVNLGGTIDGRMVLTESEVQTILTPQTLENGAAVAVDGPQGLGYRLRNVNRGPLRYQHAGTNAGFRAAYVGYPTLGAGVVVLTNGYNPDLRWHVVDAVVRTYGWE